jgi:hypothetical protein
MPLLDAVEDILGSVETWPSHILEYLFCPTQDLTALHDVIAFFYGNGVPCHMAKQLFYACNPNASGLATERFYTTYSDWDSRSEEAHLASYYNMRLAKYVYLNGSNCNTTYESVPFPPYDRIGIDKTSFPTMIRCWLPHVRIVPYY